MAKLRLNNNKREILLVKAKEVFIATEELEKRDQAKADFDKEFQKLLKTVFPEKDLKVLIKHDATTLERYFSFNIIFDDKDPVFQTIKYEEQRVPRTGNWKYCLGEVRYDSPFVKALKLMNQTEDAYKKAQNTLDSDYTQLIRTAKTLEDVTAIWEDVDKFRADLGDERM